MLKKAFNPLDSASDLVNRLAAFRSQNRVPFDASVGDLLGAALGGGTAATTGQRAGETRAERRARLLRNAVAGGAMGAGAGASISAMPDLWTSLFPPATQAETAARRLSTQFQKDKPLGGLLGRVMGITGGGALGKVISKARDHKFVENKARDFVSRLSTGLSDGRAAGEAAWSDLKAKLEAAHNEFPAKIDAEVSRRVGEWGKAPEYTARVNAELAKATADPSFERELQTRVADAVAKSPSRAIAGGLADLQTEIKNLMESETKSRIMEDITRAKGLDFRKLVEGEMLRPQTNPVQMAQQQEKELLKHLMSKVAPMASELRTDWGNAKIPIIRDITDPRPGRSPANTADLVRSLETAMRQGEGTQLLKQLAGNDKLFGTRWLRRGGYTGAPDVGRFRGATTGGLMAAGMFLPEIMRNLPGAAAKGSDIIEETFQP